MIPFLSGIVGYLTNWLAIQMTFYPLEFLGPRLWQPKDQPFGLFGWQGIIPSKAGKMAGIMTDLMLEKLLDMKELFARVGAAEFFRCIQPKVNPAVMRLTAAATLSVLPEFWLSAPTAVKENIYDQVEGIAQEYLQGLLDAIKENIHEVFDIKHLCVTTAENNKEIVVDMFQKVGDKEFTLLIRSGLYFGFLFGIVQSGVYYVYPAWWLLPLGGFIVGWLTNYLALKLIFEPINPVRLGPFTLQGAFLKRQEEVSVMFAKLSGAYYLRAEQIWPEVLEGGKKADFHELVSMHTKKFVGKYVEGVAVPFSIAFSREDLDRLKEDVSLAVEKELPLLLPLSYDYTDEALRLEETIAERMRALPPDEFEGVLHPVFKEDEIKLIVVGGLLGMGVGFLQVFLSDL